MMERTSVGEVGGLDVRGMFVPTIASMSGL